jgi:hypothetical protein
VTPSLLLPSLLMHVNAGRYTAVMFEHVTMLLRKTLNDEGALLLLHFLDALIANVRACSCACVGGALFHVEIARVVSQHNARTDCGGDTVCAATLPTTATCGTDRTAYPAKTNVGDWCDRGCARTHLLKLSRTR